MLIFSGKACFSPSVSSSLLEAWVQYGGTLTTDKKDNRRVAYFFCNGPSDPWVSKLAARSIVVIHANWVHDAVKEKFPIPVARYVLDDHYSVSDSDSTRSLAPAAHSTVYLKRDSISTTKRRNHEYVSHHLTKKIRSSDLVGTHLHQEYNSTYDDQSGLTLVNPELSTLNTFSEQDTNKSSLDLKYSNLNFWTRAITSFQASTFASKSVKPNLTPRSNPAAIAIQPFTISVKTFLRSIPLDPQTSYDEDRPAYATLFMPGKMYMGKEMRYLGRD